ncbi:MAG: nitronate monooxygenase, partial [Deltaproteobacteria bacterium]|nr:nitronate monooxygenase [Deltaproteobacteria bacterium]
IGAGTKPNCESMGYILDREGDCSYIEAYRQAKEQQPDNISVKDKTCLCTQMRGYNTWTCGHLTSRLKETSQRADDGIYRQLTTEEVFNDYRYGTGQ